MTLPKRQRLLQRIAQRLVVANVFDTNYLRQSIAQRGARSSRIAATATHLRGMTSINISTAISLNVNWEESHEQIKLAV